ncbi:hypothetical protein COCON_G00099740 [Conger conger]|uniref:Uncharacterized protein n=1 Tax=Conger conger TaxID=82655 RepID=A0A9Q1DMW1_CONCO|nr:hypothetical protein COCON_G00099740 [Conger conger]
MGVRERSTPESLSSASHPAPAGDDKREAAARRLWAVEMQQRARKAKVSHIARLQQTEGSFRGCSSTPTPLKSHLPCGRWWRQTSA